MADWSMRIDFGYGSCEDGEWENEQSLTLPLPNTDEQSAVAYAQIVYAALTDEQKNHVAGMLAYPTEDRPTDAHDVGYYVDVLNWVLNPEDTDVPYHDSRPIDIVYNLEFDGETWKDRVIHATVDLLKTSLADVQNNPVAKASNVRLIADFDVSGLLN